MRVVDVLTEVAKFGSTGFNNGEEFIFIRRLSSGRRYHVVIEGNIYELSEVGFIQFFKNIKNR